MLEKVLEHKACEYIRDLTGLAFKWVSPGMPGVPDRIFILPGPRIIFCEFKRPGKPDALSPRQIKFRRKLIAMGCDVWVTDDMEKFKDAVYRLMKSGEAQ